MHEERQVFLINFLHANADDERAHENSNVAGESGGLCTHQAWVQSEMKSKAMTRIAPRFEPACYQNHMDFVTGMGRKLAPSILPWPIVQRYGNRFRGQLDRDVRVDDRFALGTA